MSETDAAEAKRRAEWLHKHKAHKDWVILSVSEIAVIRAELEATERERDEAKTELEMWRDGNIMHQIHKDELEKAERERDELRRMSAVELMGENLNVKHHVTEWENRCIKAERERDEARAVLREIANASHFDNIGNWARNKAKKALEDAK
jgi:hypothetical protein